MAAIRQRKELAKEYSRKIPRPQPAVSHQIVSKARAEVQAKARELQGLLGEYERRHRHLQDQIKEF
jgi:hypothetical protein